MSNSGQRGDRFAHIGSSHRLDKRGFAAFSGEEQRPLSGEYAKTSCMLPRAINLVHLPLGYTEVCICSSPGISMLATLIGSEPSMPGRKPHTAPQVKTYFTGRFATVQDGRQVASIHIRFAQERDDGDPKPLLAQSTRRHSAFPRLVSSRAAAANRNAKPIERNVK